MKIIKNEIKNILITRTDRLGDVILTLPLVSETKKVFPDSKVYFLVKKYVEELINDYNGIDELVKEEKIISITDKYKFFKDKNLDLVINVKPRFDLALLFFLLNVKYRIGTAYRWYSFLYNCKVYEHRKDSIKHESDYNLNLLKNFFDEVSFDKKFYFKYTEEEKNNLNRKLSARNLNLNEKFIVIHPGSGNSAKDLSAKKLSDYINLFLDKFVDYQIILTGLAEERELTEKIIRGIKDEVKDKVSDLSGFLNLRELLTMIDNSQLFISNSTGPIHIAGALNKNIIGFYPNEKPMSETRWNPLSTNVSIMKPDKENEMDSIKVEDIIKQTEKFLK